MALMNSFGSSLYNQDSQQNQYLTGDPNTQSGANTDWMGPTKPIENTGFTGYGSGTIGGGNISTTQSNPPSQVQNGTMLGSIAAGNVGQYMPEGYDQGKWNDPNKHDPKYDIGRVLSKYPPTPAGLDAAMPELERMGYRRTGKDSIAGADGYPIDVGRGFSDVMAGKTQQGAWWFNPSNPGEWNAQGQANQSMLGQQMSQQQDNTNTWANNDTMNRIWQMMQGQRQIGNQQQQNAGTQLGYNPGNGGFTGYGNGNNPHPGQPLPQPNIQPLPTNTGSYTNPQPGYSYIPHIPGTNIW